MKKTDKEDALKLARLVETIPAEYLPIVPSPEEEQLRRLSGGQVFPKHERTRLTNRLHALFVGAGVTTISKKKLARDESRRLAAEQPNGVYRRLAEQITSNLVEVEQQITLLNEEIHHALNERSD